MKPIVAVIGSTGLTGQSLVSALRRRDAHVRAITRTVEPEPAMNQDVEIRQADLTDVQSLTAAVAGAHSIHFIAPVFDRREVAFGENVIKAAKQSKVDRIVYHSVLHAPTPDMPHHSRKAAVELLLRHSDLAWTILQPAMYAQSAMVFLDLENGELIPGFNPERLFTPIDINDLSEAAAAVHVDDGHVHATYELAGSERLNCLEMAAQIGEILERPITTRQVPISDLSGRMARATGFDHGQVEEIDLMLDHYDRYGLAGNANVLEMLLGRRPASFQDAMRRTLLERRIA